MASDDFNRADEVLTTPWHPTSANFEVLNNEIAVTTNTDQFAYYASAAASNDQYAELAPGLTNSAKDGGPAVRIDTGGAITGYLFDGNGTGILGKHLAGSFTTIASGFARTTDSVAFACVAGDVLRIEVQGTTLRVYWNGVQLKDGSNNTSWTDSSISTGQPGVFIFDEAFDNFVGGDLGGATNATVDMTGVLAASTAAGLVPVPAMLIAPTIAGATASVVAPPKPRPAAPFSEINIRL